MKQTIIKNTLRINNGQENNAYYQAYVSKGLQVYKLANLFEMLISYLVVSRSFLYYINSYKNKTDVVWINVSFIRGILGNEKLKLDLPPISLSIINLEILRRLNISGHLDRELLNTFYYQEVRSTPTNGI